MTRSGRLPCSRRTEDVGAKVAPSHGAIGRRLDPLRQLDARLAAPPSVGDLPQVVGRGLAGSSKACPALGIGDVGFEVHARQNSTLLPRVNSTVPVSGDSKLLDACGMETKSDIRAIKAARRKKLAALLDKHGKVELSRLTDINADYLWQMGKGEGKSARGVNDNNARKIESGTGNPPFWLDSDDDVPPAPAVSGPATAPEYVRVLQLEGAGEMGDGAINDDFPEVIRAMDFTPSYIRSVVGFVPPPGRLVLVTGRGDSMIPVIQPGESLIVDTGTAQFDGDGIYLINTGHGQQIKGLQARGDAVYVVSANTALYPPFPMPAGTVIGGKVYLRNRIDRLN